MCGAGDWCQGPEGVSGMHVCVCARAGERARTASAAWEERLCECGPRVDTLDNR